MPRKILHVTSVATHCRGSNPALE
ncbi:hypothetical protein CO2235_MP80297 [Cupriavidus oxalaticus]|uniref:Uncharacterized protein n=1 Tax=Cupriavidus oxalaticus TaxID=96344 RepID=A0A375GRK8_9BURK|nr:hypothetical protein CO2235_MP80297 [Cupriavidus oxalaticus]